MIKGSLYWTLKSSIYQNSYDSLLSSIITEATLDDIVYTNENLDDLALKLSLIKSIISLYEEYDIYVEYRKHSLSKGIQVTVTVPNSTTSVTNHSFATINSRLSDLSDAIIKLECMFFNCNENGESLASDGEKFAFVVQDYWN